MFTYIFVIFVAKFKYSSFFFTVVHKKADLMTDDQGTAEDNDDEGAMPNWVPTFTLKFPGAGAPNWMTAYPTILYRLWQFTGDKDIIRKHWPHLKSYINWYA